MKIHILFLITVLMYATGCAQQKDHVNTTTNNNTGNMMNLTEEEWKTKLTPTQYYVLREKGTEAPFTGEFVFTKSKGTYHCAACGEPLFSDDMKFDSHCGWPSFDREIAGGKIIQSEDNSHGMHRVEITCARCGGHLGHLFDDGPTETGMRYCVNSASLSFEPRTDDGAMLTSDTLTLGGGCFWCIEAVFEGLKGVQKVESGYCGGHVQHPSYKEVCSGNTGHAESVRITFNPKEISMDELLEVFFTLHDPTTLNQQGADIGTQYRSVIFYRNEIQKNTALQTIALLNDGHVFERKIVTEVSPVGEFYPAENYHQEYYELHQEEPYCKAVIQPKMDKLHKLFSDKLKASTSPQTITK